MYGLAAYLNAAHFVPLERTTEILEALCGARPSDGTIALNLQLAANQPVDFEATTSPTSICRTLPWPAQRQHDGSTPFQLAPAHRAATQGCHQRPDSDQVQKLAVEEALKRQP